MAISVTRQAYRYDHECIDVEQEITEAQFREIERILGQPPQRFKEWCDRFYFQLLTREQAARLCGYLADQQIVHAIELRQTWDSGTLAPAPSGEETPPTVAELVTLAAGLHLTSERLDDVVHDAAAERAAQINSEGLDGQIKYLVLRTGARAARDAITQAAGRLQESPA